MATQVRALAAGALLVAAAIMPAAKADELSAAYASVLSNPTDSEINLQYALVAEGMRKWRLALATYERILQNDPGNKAARAGLQRVRRIIEPNWTRIHTELGVTYNSNALHDPASPNGEVLGFGSLRVTDERTLGMTRWRSGVTLYGEAHSEQSDLSTIYLSAETGPVWNIPGILAAFHPTIGAATGYFEGRFAYWEVNTSASIEGYLDGALQWARVRAGYRDYAAFFTTNAGYYIGADARLVHSIVPGQGDALSVAPWFLYSNIDGSVLDSTLNQITPGRYTAEGVHVEYDFALGNRLSVGPFVDVGNWRYATDVAPSGAARNDLVVAPGVNVLFRNIFNVAQTNLRLQYKYSMGNSNDDAHDYTNHAVTLAIVSNR
ncbi:MAG TPA: hypothetical protein VFB16_02430 [Bauldia sp.]|nr:hypothetical protein [Bauldia sp.]